MDTPTDTGRISLSPGSVVAGRFEIQEKIGSGGMGLVYRALDRELNDQVALKLLHEHLAQDESIFRRFRNEVLVARSLSHPNIVRTHDIGSIDDSHSYISMEFVKGQSLREFLEDRATGEETIRPGQCSEEFSESLSILIQILAGISYAHGKNVIHRDLKPANVIIAEDGEVKLADFGTARIIGMDTSITRTGQVVGTPDYMSPEQVRGEKLDPRSDLYSLGMIAYELIVGVKPFVADSPVAVAFKHLNEPIPETLLRTPGVPEWYDAVVRKATAKDREERYESASTFAQDLLHHMPLLAQQTGFFSVDGSHVFLASSVPQDDSPKEDEAIADKSASSSSGFELGDTKNTSAGAWTLEFDGIQEENTGKESLSKSGRRVVLPFLGILSLIAISLVFALSESGRERLTRLTLLLDTGLLETGLLDTGDTAISVPESQPKAVEENELDGASLSLEEAKRAELRAELLAFGGAEEVSTPTPTVSKETLDIKSSGERVQTAKVVPKAEPTPEAAAEIEKTPIEEIAPKPNVDGFRLSDRGRSIPASAAKIDSLRSVRWEVELLNVSKVGSRVVRDLFRINVFDPAASRVVARLQTVEVKKRGASMLASGSFDLLAKAKPKTGSLRLDLVYDGEVLKSKDFSLFRAKVSFARPASSSVGATGGTLASIPKESSTVPVSPVKLKEKATVTPAPQASTPLPPSQNIGGIQEQNIEVRAPRVGSKPFRLGEFNRSSRELPPAAGLAGSVVSLPTSSLNPEPSIGAAVSTLSVQSETFSGVLALSTETGGTEDRSLTLRVRFDDAIISGSATLDGFASFVVKGKSFARGFEMELQSRSSRFRLTGSRRDRALRGRYQLFTDAGVKRGRWNVEKLR